MLDIRQVLDYNSGSTESPLGFIPSDDIEWRVVGRDDWSGQLLIFWRSTDVHKKQRTSSDSDVNVDGLGIKISFFNTRTQRTEVIFTSEEYYDIVQCAIDQERTRIAFVCKAVQKCHIQSSDFGQQECESLRSKPVGYTCYWAVLNSDFQLNRACALNCETLSEISVQFLSSTQLLGFVLQEAIYLYTLPSKGDLRLNSLSAPVLYEKLTGPFPWVQWDVIHGRVFYLQFRSPQRQHLLSWDNASVTTTNDTACSSADLCPVLVGLQFHSHSAFETLLNIPLETLIVQVPENMSERSFAEKGSRQQNPVSNRMSDITLGLQLQMLVQSCGAASICQGIVQQRLEAMRSPDSSTGDSTFLEISYCVTLLHHGCTLHCNVNVRDCPVADVQLMFAPTDDGILVMVPGLFTHLLDVGLDHEPSNHILTSECELPVPEEGEFIDCVNQETNAALQLELTVTGGANRIRSFDVNITPESLLSALKQSVIGPSSASSVQGAILHQLLMHRTDFSTTEKALKHLIEDVRNPQITGFFQEFLLCGSFALSRDHLEDGFISSLPPSASKPLNSLNETSYRKKMHTRVSYTALLKDATSMLLSPSERHIPRRSKTSDTWSLLWNHMRRRRARADRASSPCRFTARPLRERLLALGGPRSMKCSIELQSPWSAKSNGGPPATSSSGDLQRLQNPNTICDRILALAAELGKVFGSSQLLNPNMRSSFVFPQFSSGEEEDNPSAQLEQIVSLNLREVSVHFSKCFPGDSSARIENAACTYVANRLHQSQLLCYILFQSLDVKPHLQGQHSTTYPYEYFDVIPLSDRKKLFALLERYLVAVEELSFPRPQGFDNFFSVLAFSCLDFNEFLRYLDYGVVQLTSEVLMCISVNPAFNAAVDDTGAGGSSSRNSSNSSDDMVIEIISRLPRQRALRLLKQWDRLSTRLVRIHDIIEQYLHYQYLSEDDHESEIECSFEMSRSDPSRNEEATSLRPALPISVQMAMKCFLLHLKRHEKSEIFQGKTHENFSTSFPYLSDDLELVRSTMAATFEDEVVQNKPSFNGNSECQTTTRH